MKRLNILFLMIFLVYQPVFGFNVHEVLVRIEGAEGIPEFYNDTDRPILFDSYKAEREKAGKIACKRYILVEKTEPEVSEAEQEDENISEPEYKTGIVLEYPIIDPDIYISAGPDGYGLVGRNVYIGDEYPAPEGGDYVWEQLNGPEVELAARFEYNTWFAPEFAGVYSFLLTAHFLPALTLYDTTEFIIDDPVENHVPCAYAGQDLYVELDDETMVTLSGTGYDADNDPLEFHWAQIAGHEVMLFFSTTQEAEFYPVTDGVYVFELEVNDGQTSSMPDNVSVVCYYPENMSPVSVSYDIAVPFDEAPQLIVLDGSESYDPDGDTLYFSWEQTEGRPVLLKSSDTEAPFFIGEKEGHYWFRLTVSDGVNDSVPVDISVSLGSDPNSSSDPVYGCAAHGQSSIPEGMITFGLCLLFLVWRRKWAVTNMQ